MNGSSSGSRSSSHERIMRKKRNILNGGREDKIEVRFGFKFKFNRLVHYDGQMSYGFSLIGRVRFSRCSGNCHRILVVDNDRC